MKRGVSNPNQGTNYNKRYYPDYNQSSINKTTSSKSLLGQTTEVKTSFSTLGFVESREPRKRHPDNIEENRKQSGSFKCPKLQQIDESNKQEQFAPALASQQNSLSDLPEELFYSILKFSDPTASRVSWLFYSTREEIMRREYNLNKEWFRPEFYTDTSGNNKATSLQQEEIEYLLKHEVNILEKTENAQEVISLFKQLKAFKDIEPHEVIKFLAREKLLDELNAAIIEVKILECQKRTEPRNLYCIGCNLTRFPGKIISKYIDYFKVLKELNLNFNNLISLPSQIGVLTALQELEVNDNNLISLPSEIGQLVSLHRIWLMRNQLQSLPPEIGKLAALQALYLENNCLQSLDLDLRENVLRKVRNNLNEPIISSYITKVQVLALQKYPYSYEENKKIKDLKPGK